MKHNEQEFKLKKKDKINMIIYILYTNKELFF